jgi:biotin carboxyl carrier protein
VRYEVDVNGRPRIVEVRREGAGFVATVDGRAYAVDAARVDGDTWSLIVGGASHEVSVVPERGTGQFGVHVGPAPFAVVLNGRRRTSAREDGGGASGGPQRLTAPMPGKVVRLLVGQGESVSARQPVVVIEAMKMENELRASRDGVVVELPARPGQLVEAGALLAVIGAR